MLTKIARMLGGDPNRREIEKLTELVDQINALEESYEGLDNAQLLGKTAEFKSRLAQGETLDDILPEAFAAVREASKRTLGMRHFDVQMIGGITLHRGKIAEMRTGEGKTLVATLPTYLNALTGKGVHVVTVNDYLARRDARWMAPVYQALGMSVGVLQMASRTENGINAFLVDLERTAPREDLNQLRLVPRKEAYLADITYGTNSEFGFDYLRDNTSMRIEDRVQRGHNYAIVDEVDNILIDEARTPLIISGPSSEDTGQYQRTAQAVRQLLPEDYEVDEKDRTVTLTEIGEMHVEQILEEPLSDPDRPEDITPEQARLMGYLEQALRAQFLYRRNKDYLVQAGKVIIIDEFTGRLMPGRRWSDGLHQAVEAKEGVKVEPENVTYATITLQNYFRMYSKLSGMTGTALTEAEEFYKIYKLDVLPIPTNLEFVAMRTGSALEEIESRDDEGYKFIYYAHRGDEKKMPVYWKRKDYPDVVFRTEEAKLRAITEEIVSFHVQGRPILVGTTSVEHSELLSNRLRAEPIRRLMQTLLIRDAWFEKNNREQDGRAIPELQSLNRSLDDLPVPELRQMARGLDLSLNPEEPANLARLLSVLKLTSADSDRLVTVMQGGVQHNVLNARKHDEESQIIAEAGAFGAVTIATNMAGRGVDIKLGGELHEDILGDVNRILLKAGYENAYDMTMEERRRALEATPAEEYGIYDTAAQAFTQHMDDMKRVRKLGGLHVLGSERHESRRIDNQLRGRSARQGDPGSSRFYLSLGDELMRLFGGAQVENLMARLNIDEAMPIESGIVGRLVEQSQTRVEGANFDVRKHLLEYDDVLNAQRARIYSQRDMVFSKEDLTEDVTDMLRTELNRRIPESLKNDEGPWKLLAYLEEVQPPLNFETVAYPSFTMRLLINELQKGLNKNIPLRAALLDIATRAMDAEREHLLTSGRTLLENSEGTLQAQINERSDTLDTFLEGLRDIDETDQRKPVEILEELTAALHLPLKLSPEQMRQLREDPQAVSEDIRYQVRSALTFLTLTRLIGAFERRMDEPINLKASQLQDIEWSRSTHQILQAVEDIYDHRRERLLGDNGQIARDLDAALTRISGDSISEINLIQLLSLMTQGSRMVFDRKTHRQGWQRTTRLNYTYLAAHMLEVADPEEVTNTVLEHLEGAQEALREVWGSAEFLRLQQMEITLSALPENERARVMSAIGGEAFQTLSNTPMQQIHPDDQRALKDALGTFMMSEIYRSLLLRVISDLWVDYLTRVEALRVSIGLEAYAQRDPLVQYKSKATDMFQDLLNDVRAGVISRMFIYRPRVVSAAASAPTETPHEAVVSESAPAVAAPEPTQAPAEQRKKRRHH
jgi:preprotein translocase subunit SecA